MDALEAYRALLTHDVGPVLREAGFRGTRPTWRLAGDRGDTAIVNAQSSTSSTRDRVRFTVNVAVVPAPTWAWEQIRLGPAAGRQPSASSTAAWWDRVHPGAGGGAQSWYSLADECTAGDCAADLGTRLREQVVPTLRRLLDRRELVAAMRAGEVGFLTGDTARTRADHTLVGLLADEGRTADMEDVITRMLARSPEGLDAFVTWARDRAVAQGRQP